MEVDGTAATRTGELYHRAITASNGASSVWKDVATRRDTGTPSTTGHFWYAATPFSPVHDADGNLTNDGRWFYVWSAENRLIQMESTPQAVTAGHPYTKVVNAYDWQGRRIAKHVWQGGTAATPLFASSTRWLYNGWNEIAEFSASSSTAITLTREKIFTWGLDLSGSLQGAGGVGGLLVQTTVASGVKEAASYDGNGNIVTWTKSTASAPTARREYDAFGNTVVSEGAWPSSFGFSTKRQDAETGLYYYGYRFYDPVTGRWLSRDPIEEEGGVNLYGFIENKPVNLIDMFGLFWGKGNLGFGPSTIDSYSPATEGLADKGLYKRLNNDVGFMGLVSSFAKSLARRYFDNSGSDYSASYEMGQMIQVDSGLRTSIQALLLAGSKYAERNSSSQVEKIFYSGGDSPGGWILTTSSHRYIHYSLGNFYYGIAGRMWHENINGKCTVTYQYYWTIDDVYDFADSDDVATPFSTDRDWLRMARLGWAKPFRVTGQKWNSLKWEKGSPPPDINSF